MGRVRSATRIKLIEGVIMSELSRPVDLLVGEFTASRLVISGAIHFADDLYSRPDSRSRKLAVARLFNNEVGSNPNELPNAVVEAFAPRSGR